VLLFSLLHHLVFYDFSISDCDDSVRLQRRVIMGEPEGTLIHQASK
jgi:hypothetical protein